MKLSLCSKKWGTTMSNNTPEPKFYDIKKLLTEDSYVIPMYQRNYAWADQEINQLIDDVLDYQTKGSNNDNYYIGTLVVYKQKDGSYEVIDGQQRLTTLSLLAIYLKNEPDESDESVLSWYQTDNLNLSFECRDKSTYTLQALFSKTLSNNGKHLANKKEDKINSAILNGYKIIEKTLKSKVRERNTTLKAFSDYVSTNIKLLRVEVPDHTDLNHYFEVMNNRGEQLEKHEILKSKLLGVVQKDRQLTTVINTVWEGVSNMEKYIQTAFNTNLRTKIFGEDWKGFKLSGFDDLTKCFVEDKLEKDSQRKEQEVEATDEDQPMSILQVLSSDKRFSTKDDEQGDDSERFRSVINFPSFLMQVLRVYIHGKKQIKPVVLAEGHAKEVESKTIRLDDKALLDEFESHILNDAATVKDFIFYLLKCKFLFDKYIIKRQYLNDDESWELKKYLKSNSNSASYNNTFGNSTGEENNDSPDGGLNEQIVMLLASFHVSIPSMSYKYWLDGALHWLVNHSSEEGLSADDYLSYLTNMADSFLFDRYLAKEQLDYYDIVYENGCHPQGKPDNIQDIIKHKLLRYGQIRNNFIFNYLDYLIWQDKGGAKGKYQDFEFSFRSSVEHFYPQTPDGIDGMTEYDLDSFGNLCLITHSQNSSFSNKSPLEKLGSIKHKYLDTDSKGKGFPNLKMVELADELDGQWSSDNQDVSVYSNLIQEHERNMVRLFVKAR